MVGLFLLFIEFDFLNVPRQVFQQHLQYHRPYRKLLRVNDPFHLLKTHKNRSISRHQIANFLPFKTILNPLIVSLSGTNLPGVPVKTSAT